MPKWVFDREAFIQAFDRAARSSEQQRRERAILERQMQLQGLNERARQQMEMMREAFRAQETRAGEQFKVEQEQAKFGAGEAGLGAIMGAQEQPVTLPPLEPQFHPIGGETPESPFTLFPRAEGRPTLGTQGLPGVTLPARETSLEEALTKAGPEAVGNVMRAYGQEAISRLPFRKKTDIEKEVKEQAQQSVLAGVAKDMARKYKAHDLVRDIEEKGNLVSVQALQEIRQALKEQKQVSDEEMEVAYVQAVLKQANPDIDPTILRNAKKLAQIAPALALEEREGVQRDISKLNATGFNITGKGVRTQEDLSRAFNRATEVMDREQFLKAWPEYLKTLPKDDELRKLGADAPLSMARAGFAAKVQEQTRMRAMAEELAKLGQTTRIRSEPALIRQLKNDIDTLNKEARTLQEGVDIGRTSTKPALRAMGEIKQKRLQEVQTQIQQKQQALSSLGEKEPEKVKSESKKPPNKPKDQRVRELNAQGKTPKEIADIMTAEGY